MPDRLIQVGHQCIFASLNDQLDFDVLNNYNKRNLSYFPKTILVLDSFCPLIFSL